MGDEFKQIREEQAQWEKRHQQELLDERKKVFLTDDGMEVKRVYTPADLAAQGFEYQKDLGFPGEYPYTRGIYPQMYRKRPYVVGQYLGHSTVEETNVYYRDIIQKGQEEFHVAWDVASIVGLDSDDPRARHDVGKCGMALDSLQDMEILFNGIDLSKVYVLYVYIPLSIIITAMHIVVAEKQGVPREKISLCPQNDVMKTYAVVDTPVFPPNAGMRLATDVSTYIARNLPKSLAFNICTYHIGEGGANRVQQLAYTLSSAKAFVKAALKRGVDIDQIAPKVAFLAYVNHREFLLEIAKTRAWRRMWAKIVREEFGAKNPASWQMWMHQANGGIDMTREPLEVNQGRVALATAAAALAGVQTIGGSTYDEPLGIPSKRASYMAILTRYLVAHECGLMDTVDPLAGSYYLEYMTNEIEMEAAKEIKKIDEMGGMLEAVTKGYVQKQITENAYKEQEKIEKGEKLTIGVNCFVDNEEEERRDYYKPNPKVLEQQTAKLQKLRATRDNARVQATLQTIAEYAKRPESDENNLLPHVIEAVKAYATVGEITQVLKGAFGEFKGLNIF